MLPNQLVVKNDTSFFVVTGDVPQSATEGRNQSSNSQVPNKEQEDYDRYIFEITLTSNLKSI
jgi:hypothetical protein